MKRLFQKTTFFVVIGISVSSFCSMTRWDLMKQKLGLKKILADQSVAAPVVNPALFRQAEIEAFLPQGPASLVLDYFGGVSTQSDFVRF